MKSLFEGVKKFSNQTFQDLQETYRSLQDGQNPHTLFITCSDSRIDPQLLTSTGPGELFVVRNVANMVPDCANAQQDLATVAPLEYAVKVLGVKNIIVCGHSNCGGCQALFLEEEVLQNKLPYLRQWLSLSQDFKEICSAQKENETSSRQKMIEQANVLLQLKHLCTYPFVQEALDQGQLAIYGWHYDIAQGKVWNYNEQADMFKTIES